MTFTAQTRIGDVVLEAPAAMRVFEALNMDYCCGGQKSLAEAAALAGQPVAEALRRLAALEEPKEPADPKQWAAVPMAALIAHLEATHHAFTRSELDRVAPLMERVLRVHGDHHPELARVAECFRNASEDLRPHLSEEETIVFPAIRALEAGAGEIPSVLGGMAGLQAEHEALGAILRELRTLTQDYTPPADACGSYRSLYLGLQSLEADLHLHIYLESHLLFPRAAALAAAAR